VYHAYGIRSLLSMSFAIAKQVYRKAGHEKSLYIETIVSNPHLIECGILYAPRCDAECVEYTVILFAGLYERVKCDQRNAATPWPTTSPELIGFITTQQRELEWS
jgi:hypothetical protein